MVHCNSDVFFSAGNVVLYTQDIGKEYLFPNGHHCDFLKKLTHKTLTNYGNIPGVKEERLKIEAVLGKDFLTCMYISTFSSQAVTPQKKITTQGKKNKTGPNQSIRRCQASIKTWHFYFFDECCITKMGHFEKKNYSCKRN